MIRSMYPFFSALISCILAQLLKPVFVFLIKRKWDWPLAFSSGGFPSSHSAMVAALVLSVGLEEQFNSTIFAVTLTFAAIVVYDAANVRYYSGQNIRITQQLLKDLKTLTEIDFNHPIYSTKVKEVLGHKWIEVFGGIVLGVLISLAIHYIF